MEKYTTGITIWGVTAVGWLQLVQPWLTAIATILAIAWTVRQWYLSNKNGPK